MQGPKNTEKLFQQVSETPRPLTQREQKFVGKNLFLAGAMMFATFENAGDLGENDLFKENAPAAVQSVLSEIAKKRSALMESLPKMRYPTPEEVCTYRAPNGTTLIEMSMGAPGEQAEMRKDGTPKSIVLDFGTYSIRCNFVNKSDRQEAPVNASAQQERTGPSTGVQRTKHTKKK